MFRYEEVRCDNGDFLRLSKELDLYLDQAIGGVEKRRKYVGFNQLETMDYVVIAYDGHTPVGCGALRNYLYESENQDTRIQENADKVKIIEVKRVYVRTEYRNQGIGTGILQYLMEYARENGYQKVLLETGEFLKESCKLYSRFGFERISNYGPYTDMKESLCMGKALEQIHYSVERRFSPEEIRELFHSVGWMSAQYAERLVQAFQKAGTVVSAWEGKRLAGLAEVLDDGELVAYVHYLLVRPEYQRQGIGEQLLEFVKDYYKDYLYLIVISEERKTVAFYEKCGFTTVSQATPLQILNCKNTV